MRQAVGEGRTVVEDVLLGTVAVVEGGAEGVILIPVVQDVALHGGEGTRPVRHIGTGVGSAGGGGRHGKSPRESGCGRVCGYGSSPQGRRHQSFHQIIIKRYNCVLNVTAISII